MADSDFRYLVDADVLIRIRSRHDSKDIYDGIIKLAEQGRVKSVRQALDEVRRFDDANAALKDHRDKLQIETALQYCDAVAQKIESLGKNAPYLWPQTGGKNPDPADPWLIGVASVHGFTLVTNENPRALKRIPAACRLKDTSCRCIRGPHFLVETRLVTEIKPEDIDPHSFFGPG